MPSTTGANLDHEQLLRLLDLAARLNQAMAPEDLLQFIIATAADVLACDAASILLYEAEADRLRFVAATGADPALLAEIPVPIEGSIAGSIFKDGVAVRTEEFELMESTPASSARATRSARPPTRVQIEPESP